MTTTLGSCDCCSPFDEEEEVVVIVVAAAARRFGMRARMRRNEPRVLT